MQKPSNEQIAHDLALILSTANYNEEKSKDSYIMSLEEAQAIYITNTYKKYYGLIIDELNV